MGRLTQCGELSDCSVKFIEGEILDDYTYFYCLFLAKIYHYLL